MHFFNVEYWPRTLDEAFDGPGEPGSAEAGGLDHIDARSFAYAAAWRGVSDRAHISCSDSKGADATALK